MSEQMCSVVKVKYLLFNDPTALISIITKQAERVVSKATLSVFCHCGMLWNVICLPFPFLCLEREKT